jgi:hypothetical protein
MGKGVSAMTTILTVIIAASLGACVGALMLACVSINRGKHQ